MTATAIRPEPWQALAARPASIRAAVGVARAFERAYPAVGDEFESAAYVALARAAREYAGAPSRTSWRGYLRRSVRLACYRELREWAPRGYRRGRDAGDAPRRSAMPAAAIPDRATPPPHEFADLHDFAAGLVGRAGHCRRADAQLVTNQSTLADWEGRAGAAARLGWLPNSVHNARARALAAIRASFRRDGYWGDAC